MTRTLLLVEDDPFLAELYTIKFREAGNEVLAAADGKEGLEVMKKEKPDVVLLDVVLPKMDGLEVLQAVKNDPELSRIPIILLTNLGQKEDVEKGLKLGARSYLVKADHTPSEVVKKVEELLQSP